MAIDFNALRSRKGSNLQALQKNLENTSEGGGYKKDTRIWKPTNKDMKSENIIRFLPVPFVDLEAVEAKTLLEENLTPMAKILKHYFQGPKGWFIENSLQTFGEQDVVREHDQPIWKIQKETKDENLKSVLMRRIPNTDYYANILVIKDVACPENNGKVMLYQFGETVRKMIDKAGNPEFETDPKFDPFDPWEGRNLNLNLTYTKKTFGGKENIVPVWDNVKWGDVTALGDEATIERIWKEEHSIAAFYDRKEFKSYDDLKAKFIKVMGLDENFNAAAPGSTMGKSAEAFLNQGDTAPAPVAPSVPAPTQGTTVAPVTPPVTPPAPVAESLDDLAKFEAMLRGDPV